MTDRRWQMDVPAITGRGLPSKRTTPQTDARRAVELAERAARIADRANRMGTNALSASNKTDPGRGEITRAAVAPAQPAGAGSGISPWKQIASKLQERARDGAREQALRDVNARISGQKQGTKPAQGAAKKSGIGTIIFFLMFIIIVNAVVQVFAG